MMHAAKIRPDMRSLHAALLLVLCVVAMVGIGWSIYTSLNTSTLSGPNIVSRYEADLAAPPETFKFQEGIAEADARSINAAVPDSTAPLVPANPLVAMAGEGKLSAIDCLTAAVYYEAASESAVGQRAVSQVVLNRVRHPAYPNSVCGVVFQGSNRTTGCQFSFTCDGSLARRPSATGWARARQVAALALSGFVEPSVGLATHYHTTAVVPYWSANLTKLKTIGAHIFYRWNGNNGTLRAFSSRYANVEIMPVALSTNLTGFLLAAAAKGSTSDIANITELSALNVGDPTAKPDNVEANNSAILESSGKLDTASTGKRSLAVDSNMPVLREGKASLLIDRK